MRVVIVGAGKVGFQLVESMLNENHDVTVIDSDYDIIEELDDNFDVLAVKGNGASSSLLTSVDCGSADLLIAVTDSDEANIVSCLTAKNLGAKGVIARVGNPEYVPELGFMHKNLGIERIINPELATAHEIMRLLFNTHASYAEDFAKGRVRILEVQIGHTSNLIEKQIKDIELPDSIIIVAITRNGDVVIPDGKEFIHPRDTLYAIGKRNSIEDFAMNAGVQILHNKIKNVMIIGGGKTAFYLSKKLEQHFGVNVKIIEKNVVRCRELAESLDNALILHGDGTDIDLLKAENIEGMDAFIAVTGFDEENILVSLLAKQLGAKKVIAKVSRSNYMPILETIGIDNAVSPKLIIAKEILRIIRGGKILSMSLLIGGRAEVLEIIPQAGAPVVNKILKKAGIPKGVIVGAIIREGKVIVPDGNSVIRSSDRIIVFTLESYIEKVNKLFFAHGRAAG